MNTLFISIVLAAVGAAPDCWPSFQGAGATEIQPDSIPLTWTPTQNIAWKANLPGTGQSSPVIWNNLVFATSIQGSMKEACHVTAIHLASGERAWSREIEGTQQVRSNYFQSRSAPTPVVDANSVYAFFETGDVVAYTHDGELLWQRSLTLDYGEFESTIGLAASPVQTADSIVILIDHEGPSYLIALDKRTGRTRWKTERTSRVSYASPSIVNVGGSPQIVVSSSGSIDGYDPADGKLLWSRDGVGGNTTATPLPFGQGCFLVAASPGMHGEREELARKSNFAMQIVPKDTGYEPKVLWATDKAMPSFGSPVVFQGHAYWVNKVGVVYCFDAVTGEQRFAERIKQGCWATPVGLGNRLYIFGKDGVTSVIAAGAEFRLLAENSLWQQLTDSSPGTEPGRGGRPASADHSAGHGRSNASEDPSQPSAANGESTTDAAGKPAVTVQASQGPPKASSGSADMGHGAGTRGASSRGERVFADPVQYGVAMVNGSLIIRTGGIVYCLREAR